MKIWQGWIPVAVIVASALGVAGGKLVSVPSFERDFPAASAPSGRMSTTVMVVEGLRCVDTAKRAAGQVADQPGVVRFVAYASRNRADITFDPSLTSPRALAEAIEGPVYDEVTGEVTFNEFKVVEQDGIKVP